MSSCFSVFYHFPVSERIGMFNAVWHHEPALIEKQREIESVGI